MDRITQQNAAMIEESTAAARSLSSEADRLSELVGKFKLGAGEVVQLRGPSLASQKFARRPVAQAPQPYAAVGSAALQPMANDGEWDEF